MGIGINLLIVVRGPHLARNFLGSLCRNCRSSPGFAAANRVVQKIYTLIFPRKNVDLHVRFVALPNRWGFLERVFFWQRHN